jgi:hypothetical protein
MSLKEGRVKVIFKDAPFDHCTIHFIQNNVKREVDVCHYFGTL